MDRIRSSNVTKFYSLQLYRKKSIMEAVALGGEVAVPYNLQSAVARLNSHLRLVTLWQP